MKEQIEKLWQLQILEQRKKALDARKDSIGSEGLRRLWQEIQAQSRQVVQDRKWLETNQGGCEAQERQIANLLEQLKAAEKQLYGGGLVHAKEMEQLSDKCQKLKKEIQGQESQLLDNMEACESLSAKLKRAELALEEGKKQHTRMQQELAAQFRQREDEVNEAVEAYCKLEASIEPAYLEIYRQLKKKLALPVAKLENGICSGCRMSLPTRQTIAGQNQVLYCDNCGRILF